MYLVTNMHAMKKLDIYLATLTIIVLLLVWVSDSENLFKIVLYLAVFIGLFISAAARRIKGEQNLIDVNKKGLIALICGHVLITILFILTGALKEKDVVVTIGVFLVYISLMVLYTIVVVSKCATKNDHPV